MKTPKSLIENLIEENKENPKFKEFLKKNQKPGKIENAVEKFFLYLLAPFNCILLGMILVASIGYLISPNNKMIANLLGISLYIGLWILEVGLISIAQKLDKKFYPQKDEEENIDELIANVDVFKALGDLKNNIKNKNS